MNKKKSAIFSPTEKYLEKKIPNAAAIIQQLKNLMQDEKPFKNPNIKLNDIAKKLAISQHLLSQLLNDNLGKSFSQFINEHRVESTLNLKQTEKFCLVKGEILPVFYLHSLVCKFFITCFSHPINQYF